MYVNTEIWMHKTFEHFLYQFTISVIYVLVEWCRISAVIAVGKIVSSRVRQSVWYSFKKNKRKERNSQ